TPGSSAGRTRGSHEGRGARRRDGRGRPAGGVEPIARLRVIWGRGRSWRVAAAWVRGAEPSPWAFRLPSRGGYPSHLGRGTTGRFVRRYGSVGTVRTLWHRQRRPATDKLKIASGCGHAAPGNARSMVSEAS